MIGMTACHLRSCGGKVEYMTYDAMSWWCCAVAPISHVYQQGSVCDRPGRYVHAVHGRRKEWWVSYAVMGCDKIMWWWCAVT